MWSEATHYDNEVHIQKNTSSLSNCLKIKSLLPLPFYAVPNIILAQAAGRKAMQTLMDEAGFCPKGEYLQNLLKKNISIAEILISSPKLKLVNAATDAAVTLTKAIGWEVVSFRNISHTRSDNIINTQFDF